MSNPLNDIAPYPSMNEVTADNLIRYEVVSAFAHELHTRELTEAAMSSPPVSEAMRTFQTAAATFAVRFAVAFLLRQIRDVAPDQADDIAAHLHGLWMDGGSMPEFLWDWLSEDGIDPERVVRAVTESEAAA